MKREYGEDHPEFAPAASFAGARPGYAFKLGEAGLGYYRDASAAREAKKDGDTRLKKKVKKGVSFAPTEQTVDAEKTVERVCRMIGKGEKALELLATLTRTQGCLENEANARRIVSALRSLETRSGQAHPARVATVVAALAAVLPRLEAAADRADVATWFLSCACPAKLRGDDTFAFAKAMARVAEAIEALGPSSGRAGHKRRDAVLHCLHAAWPTYAVLKRPWAKTPVETCVMAAAAKRHLFEKDQRDRLDELTSRVTEFQRAHVVY